MCPDFCQPSPDRSDLESARRYSRCEAAIADEPGRGAKRKHMTSHDDWRWACGIGIVRLPEQHHLKEGGRLSVESAQLTKERSSPFPGAAVIRAIDRISTSPRLTSVDAASRVARPGFLPAEITFSSSPTSTVRNPRDNALEALFHAGDGRYAAAATLPAWSDVELQPRELAHRFVGRARRAPGCLSEISHG